jgi:hypothetical protein
MSGGAQQAGQTTQTQLPPNYMYPEIGTGLSEASSLLNSGGPNFYPGQQVASFNPIQNQSFTNTNNLDNTLTQGSGNPYEQQMFQQEAQAIQPQLASQFAGSGRDIVGSMPLASQQLNNMGASFFGNQYQNDVGNAMNAANQQQQLGGTIQNQSQNLINASQNAYNYNQQQPFQNLSAFESNLSGLQPGSQQQSPYFSNPAATGLGALAAGKSLFGGSKGASTAATSTAATS